MDNVIINNRDTSCGLSPMAKSNNSADSSSQFDELLDRMNEMDIMRGMR